MDQKIRQQIADFRRKYSDLNSKDDERMKEAAAALLNLLGVDSEKAAPLRVVHLLKEMGFGLFRAGFVNPNQSGLIAVDSALPEKNPVFHTDRVVLVNQKDTRAHQRFTVAHELAHYIFDYNEATQPTYYKAYFTTEKEDEIELRANRFAAELMMPTDTFKREFEAYRKEQGDAFSLPDAITYLRGLFDAPATAVHRRLNETGYMEGA